MISQLSPQRRSLLATITLAAGAVMFLVFFFKPRHEAIGMLRLELQEKRQYLDATGMISDSVQLAHRDLESVKHFVNEWESQSPTQSQLPEHYAQIAEAGREAGVVISKFDPQAVEELRSVWRGPLQLSVEGSYEQVFAFVHRLEGLDATAWIEQLKLEQVPNLARDGFRGETDGSPRVRCQIDWVVFSDYRDFPD